jgi:pyrimidine operon attenuation protein/uracil phosphoribosyltransferase
MKFEIKNNKFNFKINDLIEIGKRTNNAKRNFLFISKLLGKHIIVKPDIVKGAGILLASLKYDNINSENIVKYIKGENIDISRDLNQESNNDNNVLVIGFAETATGLGMSVASAIKNCTYQTTTREPVINMNNLLQFEEEHCHATTHQCFSLLDANFNNYDEIILVDDEITTGKTMLNLITELRKISNVKKFTIFTVLDWRTDEYLALYEDYLNNNNIELNVYSVMSGFATNENDTVYTDDNIVEEISEKDNVTDLNIFERIRLDTSFGKIDYIKNSGRFGVKQSNIKTLEEEAKKVAEEISKNHKEEKILILGHGENIYIPSRIASYLNADYRTTTRSPIYCDGNIIKTKNSFIDRGVTYYFYNKDEIEEMYDKVILITETPLYTKLSDNMELYYI